MRIAFLKTALKFLSLLKFDSVATFCTQVKNRDAIVDHPLLDLVVKRTVSLKGGHLIDFNEGWLQLMVYHDVEAEDLKAHTVLNIVWLARTK